MTVFGVVIEKDEDGWYAYIPAALGCYAQGDTYEEVLSAVREVLLLVLEELTATGQEIPEVDQISLTTVDVTV
ncbi:type II toxin-antitoxin system HicB family antitoxin [Methanoculleus sp. FWC-SCC1]|uniref:Type II toxin-antitoxin system HicB family antitoxin n=1 Tax=Methanoculleus frigidifontis TaxID=2584085 RepID=A0ABT8MCR9_9EURY|nr:type II toxin-antitoxin system HicB family antitoxin [Methanoculleus sp. FWC-SCC1]MDN7025696.1 type II toxin-antitoxin system HicB family antitoxin [Methanoculleus sp. FWC-SCC1]